MFTAVDDQGGLLFASSFTEDKLCYCSGCREEVIFKKGVINQPHFAHKRQSFCQYFSEGETSEHIKGKLLLYEWFKREKFKVKLELFIPELKQRPDLFINYKETRIAIEFQCSPISKKIIKKRTRGYIEKGIKVIWILGKKLKVSNKFTSQQYDYLSINKNGQYNLLQLNQDEQCLEIITNIRSSDKGIRFKKKFLPFESDKVAVEKILNTQYLTKEAKMKRKSVEVKKLQHLSFYKDKRTRRFFELLYQNNLSIQTLPDVLFYSVSNEWLIRTFSYQWKLLIFLWINTLSYYEIITLKRLGRKVNSWKKENELIQYLLPYSEETNELLPFIEFLNVLSEVGFLKKVGELKWVRIKIEE